MKYKELTQNISGSLRTLSQDSPDLMKSFNQLSQTAMRDGVIDPKTKELIALAIGVAARCDGCIGFHVNGHDPAGTGRSARRCSLYGWWTFIDVCRKCPGGI